MEVLANMIMTITPGIDKCFTAFDVTSGQWIIFRACMTHESGAKLARANKNAIGQQSGARNNRRAAIIRQCEGGARLLCDARTGRLASQSAGGGADAAARGGKIGLEENRVRPAN